MQEILKLLSVAVVASVLWWHPLSQEKEKTDCWAAKYQILESRYKAKTAGVSLPELSFDDFENLSSCSKQNISAFIPK